jgi:transcriptional regulator with XRE-family HTH domain
MRGDRILQLREHLGWTQEDLAEALQVPVLQINRWENNKNKPGSAKTLHLAEVLGCSADYLLGLTDDPTPNSMTQGNLTAKERAVLSAWRRGERLEAIKVIVEDS